MRKLPPLNALRAFEAAARLGHFGQAANELCVTNSAISHQIRSLEAALGVALFEKKRAHAICDGCRAKADAYGSAGTGHDDGGLL
ncbi:LysR family transcriptional regulator [Undibacterium arcticum]